LSDLIDPPEQTFLVAPPPPSGRLSAADKAVNVDIGYAVALAGFYHQFALGSHRFDECFCASLAHFLINSFLPCIA